MNQRKSVENKPSDVETGGRDNLPGQAHQSPANRVGGIRHRADVISIRALSGNCKNLICDVKGAGQEKKIEAQSTKAQVRGGPTRSSVEVPVMGAERRGWSDLLKSVCQPIEGRNM